MTKAAASTHQWWSRDRDGALRCARCGHGVKRRNVNLTGVTCDRALAEYRRIYFRDPSPLDPEYAPSPATWPDGRCRLSLHVTIDFPEADLSEIVRRVNALVLELRANSDVQYAGFTVGEG
jgi:hypothetical protein